MPTTVMLLISITFVVTAVGQTQSPAESQQESPSPPSEIDARSATWIEIAPEGADGSVSLPGKPRVVTNRFNVVEGQPDIVLHQHIISTNQGQIVFVFNYHDLHADMSNLRTKAKALDGAVRGSVARVSGTVISQKQKRLRPHDGREFVYVFTQSVPRDGKAVKRILKSHSVVYIVNQRMYELTVIQTQKDYDETLARKFLDSFQLSKKPPKNAPAKKQKDTAKSDGQ